MTRSATTPSPSSWTARTWWSGSALTHHPGLIRRSTSVIPPGPT
ncbi:hypothetical protein [Ornithinimicrobium kibberense]